jgi:hypothetical protein
MQIVRCVAVRVWLCIDCPELQQCLMRYSRVVFSNNRRSLLLWGSLAGFCFGHAPRWHSLAPLFSCFSPSAVLFGITLLRVFPIPRRPVDPLPNSTSAPHPHSREAQSGPPPFAGTLIRHSSRHYTPRSIYTVSLACDMPPARRSALHRLRLESALEITVGLPSAERTELPFGRS